jgi:GNAT superfamily N-acetyltransferase
MTMLAIRKAVDSDLQAVLDLYQHLHSHDDPLPDTDRVKLSWRNVLKRTDIFLGFNGAQLVASCTLVVVPNMTRGTRPYALIENVVTHADHRRKGFGRQMLQHALAEAWAADCYKVMLLTGSRREETLRFYEAAGFSRGVKTAFVASPPGIERPAPSIHGQAGR